MLVLSRKLSQQIVIGQDIRITVLKIDRNQVRIGIEAPRDVCILRKELGEPDESRHRMQNGAELAGQSSHPVKAALDHQHRFASPRPFHPPFGITS